MLVDLDPRGAAIPPMLRDACERLVDQANARGAATIEIGRQLSHLHEVLLDCFLRNVGLGLRRGLTRYLQQRRNPAHAVEQIGF